MADFLSNFDPKSGDKKPPIKKDDNSGVVLKSSPRLEELSTEIDPNYKKRKIAIIGGACAALVLCIGIGFFAYNQMVHVSMPDFVNKSISEAQKWGADNDIEFDLSATYSEKQDENIVLKQDDKKGSNVRKGSKIKMTVSKGADPEVALKLPNFQEMDLGKAQSWIKDNKATNLKLVQEFSDDVEVKKNIKFEFKDTTITADTYKRKDHAVVYYSKGKEVFKKEVKVPNFSDKTKTEVEEWAKANLIEMTYVESDSNTIDMGKIISQSITAGEKVAKKDAMSVTVSLGKAAVVPNFGQFNSEQAMQAKGLNVIVQKVYNASVPYGKLISQSSPAGTKFVGNDDNTVTVIYSEGMPYLKDYRTQTEGDLPRLFFDDYNSKGSNITYVVHYVDSAETRGTIVDMSNYNAYVPLSYHVAIYVSKGNLEKPAE